MKGSTMNSVKILLGSRFVFLTSFLVMTTVIALTINGCSTTGAKVKQLERVAKDWSLVIRASQVIPVYPLIEDLQPGDIFLVQTPIEKQASLYRKKGFLPLDQHIERLQPDEYRIFYMKSYKIEENTNTPHHWQFPAGQVNGTQWEFAPRAAFPSYTFSVKRGAGVNLALPVHGVPIALNLLGTGSAQGSITIADAYSYGIDIKSLNTQVDIWARKNQNFLKNFSPEKDGDNVRFLRIVNRVYLTGKVNISLFNDEALGGAVSGGIQKPVDLLKSEGANASENYKNVIEAFNKSLENAAPNLPGGTLKLASASSRSVTLIETFPRPLVIGYIGFDRAILKNGELGTPIPTQSQLTKTPVIQFIQSPRFVTSDQEIMQLLINQVDNKRDRDNLYESAAKIISDEFQTVYLKRKTGGLQPRIAFIAAKNDYLEKELGEGPKHKEIIRALEEILK